jgi:Uma2 family endonuclease
VSATVTSSITVEQFHKLDLPDNLQWELQDGEVVGMTFPSVIHRRIQERLVELLKPLLTSYEVLEEYSFVAGNHEERSADVGAVEWSLARQVSGSLAGAPEFVIEVKSPSNSRRRLEEYRKLCMAHGTELFWIVDPEEKTVDAYVSGEILNRVWQQNEEVPVRLGGQQVSLSVCQIFDGIV